ncbi:MAG: type II toxin-antitoxin system Phd/YefM family antitoxin [Rhodoglobus sp.]|nr:type II toxin-antitoxin system Phd/YefM family antitoxin [Rhodoglobus sp.]
MKTRRISHDLISVAEFELHPTRWFRRLADNNHPVVITQDDKPLAVLLSAVEFDRIVEGQHFLREVASGVVDLDAGRAVTTDELKQRLGQGDTDPKKVEVSQ